ncbi:MAG TPA: EamA family transporter [Candidatus Udaeobacter sp.]|nr:EamA family transporter [Candidatus Udaeobacter sp.]
MRSILLVLCSVTPAVAGQLILKYAIGRMNLSMEETGPIGYYLKLFSTPIVLLGFFMYGLSSLVWLFILSKMPLSLAYPLVSMGYVLVVFFSWLLLREQVGWTRLMGVGVICLGVVLLATTAPSENVSKPTPAGETRD